MTAQGTERDVRVPAAEGSGEPFGHSALLYASDEEYVAGAVRFLQQGIDAGEGCIALTTPATQVLLRTHLPRGGDDVEFADPGAWYTTSPGAMLASLNRCFREYEREGRRVRILGGVQWHGLGHLAQRAWHRYESALTPAFAGRRAALLCGYDLRTLADDVVATALRTHPVLSRSGADSTNTDYVDPVAFCAEFDLEPLPVPDGPIAELRFDGASLGAARNFTADHAAAAGLDDTRVSDLVLAVAEVTGNVVRHGGGPGRLWTWREGDNLVFEIADDGGMPPNPLAGWLPPPLGSGERYGLWLARQLVDVVETRHGAGWQVRLYTEV